MSSILILKSRVSWKVKICGAMTAMAPLIHPAILQTTNLDPPKAGLNGRKRRPRRPHRGQKLIPSCRRATSFIYLIDWKIKIQKSDLTLLVGYSTFTAPNDLSLAAQDNQLHKHFLILFPKFFETVVKRQSTIYHPDLHKV
jgi:hypothetical protein